MWFWCWTWRRHSSGQSPCGVGLGEALQLPKEDLAAFCGCFEHQVRVQFEGCVVDGHLARVKVELLVFVHCVAGCVE